VQAKLRQLVNDLGRAQAARAHARDLEVDAKHVLNRALRSLGASARMSYELAGTAG
jgi:hypothetical protein